MNDLAAVAILSGAVSIPTALYTQGHVVNGCLYVLIEFSLIWLSILDQTERNQQLVKVKIDNQ